MPSIFSTVSTVPPIEVFHVNQQFADETSPYKVNGSIGAYRTECGAPWVLPSVREAETLLEADAHRNHEYLPVLGCPQFSKTAVELLLGADCPAVLENRARGIQCVAGSGSLRVGAEFLSRVLMMRTVYVSNPSWPNHDLIFRSAGFAYVEQYRYWDAKNCCFDIDGMLEDLEEARSGSVVILHACAHNPTGIDPTKEQWKRIAAVIKKKKLLSFFDVAYQGFASGDLDEDAWAVRYFVEQGMELLAAQSFSKNFGLYDERVGNLTIVVTDPTVFPAFFSQLAMIIRALWCVPQKRGAQIVHTILTTPKLRISWLDSVKTMATRIRDVRIALREALEQLQSPGTWQHMTRQIGMFSYTGLSSEQVERLANVHKVFMLHDGRLALCGLNTHNVRYVAMAIDETMQYSNPHKHAQPQQLRLPYNKPLSSRRCSEKESPKSRHSRRTVSVDS